MGRPADWNMIEKTAADAYVALIEERLRKENEAQCVCQETSACECIPNAIDKVERKSE